MKAIFTQGLGSKLRFSQASLLFKSLKPFAKAAAAVTLVGGAVSLDTEDPQGSSGNNDGGLGVAANPVYPLHTASTAVNLALVVIVATAVRAFLRKCYQRYFRSQGRFDEIRVADGAEGVQPEPSAPQLQIEVARQNGRQQGGRVNIELQNDAVAAVANAPDAAQEGNSAHNPLPYNPSYLGSLQAASPNAPPNLQQGNAHNPPPYNPEYRRILQSAAAAPVLRAATNPSRFGGYGVRVFTARSAISEAGTATAIRTAVQ